MSLTTRLSLINSLKEGAGDEPWERFYGTYSGVVVAFARRQGCDEHTALDVLQETVMVVMRKMPEFEYDADRGKFRNWLLTVAANKARRARARARFDRHVPLDGNDGGDLPLAERLEDGAPRADEVFAARWREAVLEDAIRRVVADPRTAAETVEVFRAFALEGRPAREVAEEFGIKENAVYQIKNRLTMRIKALVAKMENGRPEHES